MLESYMVMLVGCRRMGARPGRLAWLSCVVGVKGRSAAMATIVDSSQELCAAGFWRGWCVPGEGGRYHEISPALTGEEMRWRRPWWSVARNGGDHDDGGIAGRRFPRGFMELAGEYGEDRQLRKVSKPAMERVLVVLGGCERERGRRWKWLD